MGVEGLTHTHTCGQPTPMFMGKPMEGTVPLYPCTIPTVHLSEGSGRKQTNNQHQMTTVVSGGLPLRFWYQTSSRCIVHAFG